MTSTNKLTGTLAASLKWTETDTDDDTTTNTVIDDGVFNSTQNWTSGVGSGEVDTVWHVVNTLSVSGAVEYDLTNLTRSLFNTSFVESFGKVKGLVLENLSTASGADISLTVTGVNAFVGPFISNTGNIQVPAKSPLAMGNYMFGWDVSATSKFIQVNDTGGSGTKYRLAVIGIA